MSTLGKFGIQSFAFCVASATDFFPSRILDASSHVTTRSTIRAASNSITAAARTSARSITAANSIASIGIARRVVMENGLEPSPKGGVRTWDEFLKIHAAHRSPNTCGFVERFIKTLQQQFRNYCVVVGAPISPAVRCGDAARWRLRIPN